MQKVNNNDTINSYVMALKKRNKWVTTGQWRYGKLQWPKLCCHHNVPTQAALV
jgi:hypothetical protein